MENGNSRTAFFTEEGRKIPAVTAPQMREVDRIAAEETGPNLWQMMENAGRSVADFLLNQAADLEAGVLILAGPGGNGGGGLCAARHLANRGLPVRVLRAGGGEVREVPAWQWHVAKAAGAQEVAFDRLQGRRFGAVVDALLGYGLQGAPSGLYAEAIRWANGCGAPVLSLDVPSGMGATTGETPGEHVRPDWVVTLALPKTGLLFLEAGAVFLADLGIPLRTFQKAGIPLEQPVFRSEFLLPLERREPRRTE